MRGPVDFRQEAIDIRQVYTTSRLVGILRVLLALAFFVLLAAQLRVLPAMYDDWVRDAPGLAGSAWLLTVAELVLFCVQVVVVCTWRLLALVADDRIFSADSMTWVNVIVGAVAAAEVLLVAPLVAFLAVWPRPMAAGALLIALVAGAVLGLLMVVMRALLRQATALRTDLEAVI